MVDVICALSDFNVILDEVSRSRNSWRFDGGIVKRRGRDIIAVYRVFGILSVVC
jgi:hypothetical protein